jgi:CTP synthase (UTP-ammonia lyase)
MRSQSYVALVGDYNPSIAAHQAIPIALELAAAHHGVSILTTWVPTSQTRRAGALGSFHGIWSVPGSPYEDTLGATEAIRFAREQQVPFLGTCGGFQHALMEYAKDVLKDGKH